MMPQLPTLCTFILISAVIASAQHGYIYQPQYYSTPSLAASFYPTSITPQANLPQPPILSTNSRTPSNFGLFNSFNLALPVLNNNYLSDIQSYSVDGRILKQYLVEEPLDDVLPPNDIGTNPIFLSDFANVFEKYARINQANRRVNQDFLRIQVSNGRTSIIQPVTRNHGPVALGSGSLGYIRRPNGSVFLGSGSLGYISNQQRVSDVNDARAPKGTAPGPTSFGDGAVNPYI